MKQEFGSNPFQYLMIFLREQPEDGIDGFQKQLINNASFSTEGSTDQYLFYDSIGNDTRIKVLVTGEIELNEKNVFIGLKMAFPEWDFQRYPLHIQKLFIKESDTSNAKEAGVIATTEHSRNSGGNQWGLPCVLNLSPSQDVQHIRSSESTDFPSLFEKVPSWISNDNGGRDFSDNSQRIANKDENALSALDEIDLQSILDLTDESSAQETTQEDSLDSSEQSIFRKISLPKKTDTTEEAIPGGDSKEFFNHFSEGNKTSPLASPEKDEDFDFSFLDEASTFSPYTEETDSRENFSTTDELKVKPFIDDEEEYISPKFREPEVEFKLEGMVEEIAEEYDPSLMQNDDEENARSSFQPYLEIINKLLSSLISRMKELPLKKIALVSLAIGSITFMLSFGVKAIEPNYENARKSAGVSDLYEWIILNDLVGTDTETNALMELWQESNEYRQFWFWYDTEWTPRIESYTKIESGLRTAGVILLSPAIMIMLVAFLDRKETFKKKNLVMDSEQTNRISLDFVTYTNDSTIVDSWAKETGFKLLEEDGTQRLYRRKGSISHPPTLCLIGVMEDQVQIEVWAGTRIPAFLIPLLSNLGLEVLESKKGKLPTNTKSLVNKLLLRFGHPPLA
jgi:hypothetical protein